VNAAERGTAPGRVSFVSRGPGDPDLAGERSAQRMATADVVVREGDGRTAAELVALARAGQHVVWVAEGDTLGSAPVVGAVLAVARAGLAFEVVPSLGASALAAAFAGVLGPAVRVSTGDVGRAVEHEAANAVVTLVKGVGEPTQQVCVTTAAEAAQRASAMEDRAEGGRGQILVVLGAPVDELRWFERRPLFGKRVLVTRAGEQAGSAAALLRDQGALAQVVPTLVVEPPADPAPLARAIEELGAGRYAWVVFTSANGVERTWAAVEAAGRDARVFGTARLAVVGPATAGALEHHGLRADVTAKEFRGEGLAESLLTAMKGQGGRVLVARALRAPDTLPDALRAAGCVVDVVAAYETHPAPRPGLEALATDLEEGRIDAVTFTSSSTVDHLCDALGPRATALLGRARLASIGPVTGETARRRGLRIDVQPRESTLTALIRALAESYAKPVT
jgi:uroporphyrinogen III methyltransferase/synthase